MYPAEAAQVGKVYRLKVPFWVVFEVFFTVLLSFTLGEHLVRPIPTLDLSKTPWNTITDLRENISLWEGVLVLKCKYIGTSNSNRFKREYFTFGGCTGPEMQIYRNKQQ